MKTKQECFDEVARHLFVQGQQSLNDRGFCAYYGRDGRRCPVGLFLDTKHYKFNMEEKTFNTLRANFYLPPELNTPDNYRFFSDLQIVHDNLDNWESSETMRKALSDLAADHGLSRKVLIDLKFTNR